MLEKINKLKSWQAALIIAVVGLAVFSTGLTNPLQGDDLDQIVNNVPVHSITNVKLFFEGGTFYNGQGLAPLSGAYYRPLMMTAFSLIYTLFGPHAVYYHLLQLFLCIGSAIFLYLFFRYSCKPALALLLSLVFLLHPIDSQVVFAVPSMQDALFFFFGILALWLLIRFKSAASLFPVALCLLLSLFAKETGVLFVIMTLVYLFWFDSRRRLYTFVGVMALPIVLYLVLRIHAIGVDHNPANAPIDNLSLGGRLLTMPSIVSFYIAKLIFPSKLATGYYWVNRTFSISRFLIPLMVDLTAVALIIYAAALIRKRSSKAQYFTFIFFAIWGVLGFLAHLQITPLDFTACEPWFYFSMAGLLGMIGVVLTVFPLHINPRWILILVGVLLLGTLGLRTAIRGFDYRSPYTLAVRNIAASKDDYAAYNAVAGNLVKQGKLSEAKAYTIRSIDIYPSFNNYFNLGVILTDQGDYAGAVKAYDHGLKYSDYIQIYNNLGALTLVHGSLTSNRQFFSNALAKYPEDSTLWFYFALLEDRNNDNAGARVAIENAARYGQAPQFIYDNIMNNSPFTITTPAGSIMI